VYRRTVYAETVDLLTPATVPVVVYFHVDWLGTLSLKPFNSFFCKNFFFCLRADSVSFNKLVNTRRHFRLFVHATTITQIFGFWRKASRFLRFLIILAIILVNVFGVDKNACLAYHFLLKHLSLRHVGLNLFCRPMSHHWPPPLRRDEWLLGNSCLLKLWVCCLS